MKGISLFNSGLQHCVLLLKTFKIINSSDELLYSVIFQMQIFHNRILGMNNLVNLEFDFSLTLKSVLNSVPILKIVCNLNHQKMAWQRARPNRYLWLSQHIICRLFLGHSRRARNCDCGRRFLTGLLLMRSLLTTF